MIDPERRARVIPGVDGDLVSFIQFDWGRKVEIVRPHGGREIWEMNNATRRYEFVKAEHGAKRDQAAV